MSEHVSQSAQPTPPTEAGHAQTDDIDVSVVALVGIFFAVALFAVVVLLQAWFYSWTAEERARKTEPDPALQNLLASQEARLHPVQGVYFDPTQNAFRMPIERAMDVVVARAHQPGADTRPR